MFVHIYIFAFLCSSFLKVFFFRHDPIEYRYFPNRHTWLIDETLTGTITLSQSGPGSFWRRMLLEKCEMSNVAFSLECYLFVRPWIGYHLGSSNKYKRQFVKQSKFYCRTKIKKKRHKEIRCNKEWMKICPLWHVRVCKVYRKNESFWETDVFKKSSLSRSFREIIKCSCMQVFNELSAEIVPNVRTRFGDVNHRNTSSISTRRRVTWLV